MIRSVNCWSRSRWVTGVLAAFAAAHLHLGVQAADAGKTLLKVSSATDAAELVKQGARSVQSYGGFHLIEVEAGTAVRIPEGAEAVPDYNLIRLNAGTINTSVASPTRAAAASGSAKRLFMVQFVGPIKPEWAQDIRDRGGQIVAYIPENTYLVYGDPAAHGAGQSAFSGAASSVVRWQGDLLPEHKLRPMTMLRNASGDELPETPYYSIQMVADDAANAETLSIVDQLKTGAVRQDMSALNYRNLTVPLSPAAAAAVAARPEVVSVTPFKMPKLYGERQSLILSGNIQEGPEIVPARVDYYEWLASKGFTNLAEPFDFAVDVTDSGIDNGTQSPGHFGLYPAGDMTLTSRVIYNRLLGTPNTNSTLAGCDGHGTIDAHIIGGYAGPVLSLVTNEVDGSNVVTTVTNRIGFPFQDSEGFFYGRGVAPQVLLGSSVIFDSESFTFPDYFELIERAYIDGARISANSWGADTAGAYSVRNQIYDSLVRDAVQDDGDENEGMILVFAAGNAGPTPTTIGDPGTSKNVITVGAAEGVQAFGGPDNSGITDDDADNAADVVWFSSRGPTQDGRRKPDIMAPGTHISGGAPQGPPSESDTNGVPLECFIGTGVSGGRATNIFFPDGQEFYTASSGTSQATPGIAGAAALVYQYYRNLGTNPPSPAMVKAILMNTARYMDGSDANDDLWSNKQGMGLADLGMALDDSQRVYKDQNEEEKFTATGQQRLFTGFIAETNRPFRVTLAWTDAPGNTVGAAYNNNLNLRVYVSGRLYRGNVFSKQFSARGGLADTRNNVESVFLPAGVSGEVAIFVDAANINSDGVPGDQDRLDQDFALIAHNMVEAPISIIVPDVATFISETNGYNNGFIDAGETLTYDFSLANVGLVDAENIVAVMLTNAAVTPVTTEATYGAMIAQGPAVTNRFTFIVNPDVPCGSEFDVEFDIFEGTTNKGTISFTLFVGLPLTNALTFENPAKILLPGHGPALPFPSTLLVSGLQTNAEIGQVTGVKVTLSNIFHAVPAQVVAVVANSRGEGVVLFDTLSNEGVRSVFGLGYVTNTNTLVISFSDDADAPITRFADGEFQPQGGNVFSGLIDIPLSLPPGVMPTNFLSSLNQLALGDPNGQWQLLMFTSAGQIGGIIHTNSLVIGEVGSGFVRNGWSLELTERRVYCDAVVSDIEVVQTASPDHVLADDILTYSLFVTNHGPNDASAVTITETLSDAVSLQKVAASQGTYVVSGQVLTFDLGPMPVGSVASIKITTKVIQPLDIVSVARASTVVELDSYPENNVVATGTARSRFVANPASINIPALGLADTYPSTVSVTGVTGVVNKVVVRVNGVSHGFFRDIDMLLVGPKGQKVMLMSDVGPGTSMANLDLVFDDSGPMMPTGPFNSGTYHVTDYEPETVTIGAPAPAPPYANALSAFNGIDPNGTWSLYIADDTREKPGQILNGWSLEIFLGNNFTNDLSLTQTMPSEVKRGVPFMVTTVVTNVGPTNATAAFVTNTVPDNVGVQSVSVSSGSHTIVGNSIIWSVGPMQRNAVATMQVMAVAPSLGSFTYTSGVRSQDNDPVLANNFAARSATVTLPDGVTENPAPIAILESGPASLYPSTITVSGVTSKVSSVTVTLLGFSHSFPKDVDVLLVGPEGQKVMLMSDAGAGDFVSEATLSFSASADTLVPRGFLRTGVYRPADWDVTLDLPTPAPAGPYGTDLGAFTGTEANGVWSLYVNDHSAGDQGGISAGWILSISTEAQVPSLTISSAGANVVLSWPSSAVGFTLQGASSLEGESPWTSLTNPAPVVIGNQNVVTNAVSAPSMFFRLVR